MQEKSEKKAFPPYVSFKSFITFINGLRENGVPSQIDRSIMLKQSGAQQSAMIAALRYLNMIDQNSKPTQLMMQLVAKDEAESKSILKKILEDGYSFLFKDDQFNLEKATGQLLADKFRQQNISGSTITKAIVFFLASAKEAGIQYSSHIKPPTLPIRMTVKRSFPRRQKESQEDEIDDDEIDDIPEGVERFQIPIPGKPNAIFIIPTDLSQDEWTMLKTMLDAYIVLLQKQGNNNDDLED